MISTLGGILLAAFFRVLQLFRRPRPVHPTGALFAATIRWTGTARSGIAWIDSPPSGGTQAGIARVSRSVGLPEVLPDVLGIAVRVETVAGRADLELASTGIGVPGRFLLMPVRTPSRAWLNTLLPYRGDRGRILIGGRTRGPEDLPFRLEELAERRWALDLYWAAPRGKWHRFAVLELAPLPGPPDSPELRFDAGRNLLPGAGLEEWVVHLREPGYLATQGDAPLAPPAPGAEDPIDDAGEDLPRDGRAEDLLER